MALEVLGREAELAALGAFLDRLPDGPGALVLAGPAGAGKTTLLRAGAEFAAGRGFTVVQTLPARSELQLAFTGLADLLGQHLESVLEELPAPQARALQVALLLAEAPRVIAAGFRSAVGALARAALVLLVIDDVQWLDRPSQAAVGFTVRRLQHARGAAVRAAHGPARCGAAARASTRAAAPLAPPAVAASTIAAVL
jgi:hypothetical protein